MDESVIKACIARFRSAEPTAPHLRSKTIDKSKFWWLMNKDDDKENDTCEVQKISEDSLPLQPSELAVDSIDRQIESIQHVENETFKQLPSRSVDDKGINPPTATTHVEPMIVLNFTNPSVIQPPFEPVKAEVKQDSQSERSFDDLDEYADNLLHRCNALLKSYTPRPSPQPPTMPISSHSHPSYQNINKHATNPTHKPAHSVASSSSSSSSSASSSDESDDSCDESLTAALGRSMTTKKASTTITHKHHEPPPPPKSSSLTATVPPNVPTRATPKKKKPKRIVRRVKLSSTSTLTTPLSVSVTQVVSIHDHSPNTTTAVEPSKASSNPHVYTADIIVSDDKGHNYDLHQPEADVHSVFMYLSEDERDEEASNLHSTDYHDLEKIVPASAFSNSSTTKPDVAVSSVHVPSPSPSLPRETLADHDISQTALPLHSTTTTSHMSSQPTPLPSPAVVVSYTPQLTESIVRPHLHDPVVGELWDKLRSTRQKIACVQQRLK